MDKNVLKTTIMYALCIDSDGIKSYVDLLDKERKSSNRVERKVIKNERKIVLSGIYENVVRALPRKKVNAFWGNLMRCMYSWNSII